MDCLQEAPERAVPIIGVSMDDLQDRELFRVRLRFLDLIKSFFVGEPDAELMSRWRGTFSALAKEQVSPRFDSAARQLAKALNDKNLKDLQDEYYKLFTDPFHGSQVETTVSYYLDGKSYSQSLVEMRSFMSEAEIAKDSSVTDPEDSLVVMLDTYASLVEEEKISEAETPNKLQLRLLSEFLEPFTEKFTGVLKKNEHADFYYLCSEILGGYLDLEKGLVSSS